MFFRKHHWFFFFLVLIKINLVVHVVKLFVINAQDKIQKHKVFDFVINAM